LAGALRAEGEKGKRGDGVSKKKPRRENGRKKKKIVSL
jgi:hypothetical protein